jgi:parallel beta-helix repeat protein
MADGDAQQGCPFAGPVVNVKGHGAEGDGRSNDTPAIEAAIEAAQEGGAVYFPKGEYLVKRSLEPKAHQLYFSLADDAAVKVFPGERAFAVFLVRSGPVEFRGLTVDGAKDETVKPEDPARAPGIWRPHDAAGAVDVVVSACRIRNAYGDGIRIPGGSDADRASDRVIVRDTVVEDCDGNGLAFGRVDNVRVESSRFERCNNGIKMLDCHDVVVHGVTANGNKRHGIIFTFSHCWHVDNCVARGNGSGTRGWGIAAGGEPAEELEPNSDFTITNNICEDNVDGGITLDPTMKPKPGKPEAIWAQRATVSGNVCRKAKLHHGIHVTHSSDVVVSGNVCTHNEKGSGIQLVSSSHVLVQGNTCSFNRNGIGLYSDADVTDPGHHVIGINLLYENKYDVRHQDSDKGQQLGGVRFHGLHGQRDPRNYIQAEPGTLYEWHKKGQGALFVKSAGSDTRGWARVRTELVLLRLRGRLPLARRRRP